MRKFLVRGSLFGLPFLVYGLLLLLIDPYNYFASSSPLIPTEVKLATSYRLNYAIWKTIAFRRDYCPNVLLGDSRVEALNIARIEQAGGVPYRNLALGGGSLEEICNLFDFAAREAERHRQPLESVCVGLNFSLYNRYGRRDRVVDATALLDNPLLYACNRNVVAAAWANIAVRYLGAAAAIEKPPVSRDEFWQHQLGPTVEITFGRYAYPAELHRRLERIAAACRERGIRLIFVILPTHVDLQRRVADFGLTDAQERFRRELAALATVYDFDYPSEITTNRDDYSDPFHARPHIYDIVIDEVWGDPATRKYAHVYGPEPPEKRGRS